jgi:hypothetical protein
MSTGKNIKFKGTRLSVGSTKAAGLPITGITKANPAVVSYTGTDPVNGTPVYISGVVGMSEVNGRWFIAVNVNAASNTLELKGVDSTGYGTYTSGGSAEAAVFVNWCELKDGISVDGGQSDEYEVTGHCAEEKEYETGLGDAGTMSGQMNYVPNTALQQFIEAARVSGETVPFRITYPGVAVGVTTFLLGITQVSYGGQFNGGWAGTFSARIKSTPHFQAA